jgi:hypothetical protein
MDGVISLSDGEFLSDPEEEYFKYHRSDVVAFDKISSKPCLVLLGEPGIGKSTAILSEYKSITSGTDKVAFFNLNEYGDETRLIDEIFKSDEFTTWGKNDYTLHLFLDSLDECRIQIPQVAVILQKQLEKAKAHLNRLHLRIACRTVDWPHVLDDSLSLLWKKEEYGVFELAPLRRKDVRIAAVANGIDPDAFIEELIRSELVPLAIKPITLEFLIDIYKQEKRFPSSKIEIYSLGCRKLCEENNTNRQDLISAGQVNALSIEQKLVIAKRIAALSIFCKKSVIYTGTTTGLSDDEISISTFIMSGESLSESNIKEVIGTGLFSGRGSQKFGFAHQTYAEFLAASYMSDCSLNLQQIESILLSSIGTERKVVPQLYETAAWLACMNKELFNSIAANDPQVLLRGDAGCYSNEDKKLLAASIMELLNAGRINSRDWDLFRTFHKLNHPGLSQQLKPFITDKTKSWNARYEATLIVDQCKLADLEDVLVDIVLDTADRYVLRTLTAEVVADIGSPECRKQLMPFVIGEGGNDPQDQLKGYALKALWPDLIDAKTLFDNLKIPPERNFSGSYDRFLSYELAKGLKSKDIPCALKWLKGAIGNGRMPFCFERIADDIMILAWKNLDQPEIAHAAADTCIAFFRHYHGILHNSDKLKENDALFNESNKQHLITDIIINRCDDFDKIDYGFVSYSPRLIRDTDISWLLAKFKKADSETHAKRWAKLILYTYNPENVEHCKNIVEAAVSSNILREVLGLDPVKLDSKEAEKLKESYLNVTKWQQIAKHKKKPQKLQPPPSERVQNCLQEIEKGKIDFWISLCYELTLEDTSEQYDTNKLFRLEITELPGWANSNEEIRRRIITAAERFLIEKRADPEKWIKRPNSWNDADIALNKAFYLLSQVDISRCHGLPVEVWAKWIPALLEMPLFKEDDKRQGHELIKIAYEKCPDTFMSVLRQQIDAENENAQIISVYEKLELCWDERLCDAVLEKVRQPHIKRGQFNSFRNLLACLVQRKHQASIEYVKSLIRSEYHQETEEGKKMIDAAFVLMENTDDACWDVIWPAITGNQEFGRGLFLEYDSFDSSKRVALLAERISANSLADLYVWLKKQFPDTTGDRNNEANLNRIDWFINDILRFLENTGTFDSCKAIEKIIDELPELDWLKSVLVEAKKNTMRKIWHPPTPEQFLAMVTRKGTPLKEAIIECKPSIWGFTINVKEIARRVWRGKDWWRRLFRRVKNYLNRRWESRKG